MQQKSGKIEPYSLIKLNEAIFCAHTHTPKSSAIEKLEILKGQDGGKLEGQVRDLLREPNWK